MIAKVSLTKCQQKIREKENEMDRGHRGVAYIVAGIAVKPNRGLFGDVHG